MKYILFTFLFSLCCLAVSAQSFEGEVVYTVSYKSNIPNLTDMQFKTMAGDTIKYYMKGGDYRANSNGKFLIWQIYINRDNKMYNKYANSGIIFWIDGAIDKDSVLSVQLNKNAANILGYPCDELILNCKSGVQKYYFTSKFPVDSKLYEKQVAENWYDYLKRANAMPLRIIINSAQANEDMIATSITPMKLDDSLFTLPANAVTQKSP